MNRINFEAITLQDCIENARFEKYAVINDGKVIGFVKEEAPHKEED